MRKKTPPQGNGATERLNEIMGRTVQRRQVTGKLPTHVSDTSPLAGRYPSPRARKSPQVPTQPVRDERRIQELRTMPYPDYLRTPEWEAKRQQVLKRDGRRCRVCNGTERLNVHHRTYERRGDENLDDLTTLCQSCHEHFHNREKEGNTQVVVTVENNDITLSIKPGQSLIIKKQQK